SSFSFFNNNHLTHISILVPYTTLFRSYAGIYRINYDDYTHISQLWRFFKHEKKADYDQTKEMVVDILQTDEGKKTLREIMNEDKMKQQLIMDYEEDKRDITETMGY